MPKFFLLLCLSGCSLGAPGVVQYQWSAHVQMPAGLSKEKQQELANCALEKINIADLRNKSAEMFPDVPKEWIEGIKIRAFDPSKVFDHPGKDIEIEITVPSSEEAYRLPSPVVEYLEAIVKEQVEICSVELKTS